MIKIKLEKLFYGQKSFQKFFELDFPINIAFGLKKASIQINEQLKIIDRCRQDLVKKHGVPMKGLKDAYFIPNDKEDAEKYKWSLENYISAQQKFQKDMRILLDQEIDIEIKKIKMEDLKDKKLSANDLVVLADFIDG